MKRKGTLEIEEGREVVRRTIVGGRPRARRNRKLRVPIGIEKVLYRAAADSLFREALFRDRKEAIGDSGFSLLATEVTILESVPDQVLTTMIGRIDLRKHGKRRFMRAVGACALAATTAAVGAACGSDNARANTGDSNIEVVDDTVPHDFGIGDPDVSLNDGLVEDQDMMTAGVRFDAGDRSLDDGLVEDSDMIFAGVRQDIGDPQIDDPQIDDPQIGDPDIDDAEVDQNDMMTAGVRIDIGRPDGDATVDEPDLVAAGVRIDVGLPDSSPDTADGDVD